MIDQHLGLGLFSAYGIEMEYMIVDRGSLAVRPIADAVLRELNGGELAEEVELGKVAVSNELVLHVIELKCQGPQPDFPAMRRDFAAVVRRINSILGRQGACLLPTAMHPTMNPDRDMCLWPHGNAEIYSAYNRVFDCRGHGWSNLQSVHINLPFNGDEEFGRLHAAVRLVLPVLPALAASSPLVEGRPTDLRDNRLEFYRNNQRKIPAITGHVVPEAVFTRRDYEEVILRRCYESIAPHDPEGLLQEEWLNSRGAIARFMRDAIEIRVVDIQESPRADFAVITAAVSVLKALAAGRFGPWEEQKRFDEAGLEGIFLSCLRDGLASRIEHRAFLDLFGFREPSLSAREFWQGVLERVPSEADETKPFAAELQKILNLGSLSERILRALGQNPDEASIRRVYQELGCCLEEDRLFEGIGS